jgi:5-methylcytosine-specific restriction endonuclease McrA
MSNRKKNNDHDKLSQVVADARRHMREREKTYRERALKIFPHVCGRCGREFSGKQLRELTVHHRDHNHDNNPPDGSNWELLCIYCHDNEHGRLEVAEAYDGDSSSTRESSGSDFSYRPFSALAGLLKEKPPGGEPPEE